LIFLIRVDVRIEKISDDFIPSLPYPLEGINGAIGTADVEENSHLPCGRVFVRKQIPATGLIFD